MKPNIFELIENEEAVESIKEVIEKDKELLNSQDDWGSFPIHSAIESNRLDIVEYILSIDSENNINRIDNNGVSPLHFAMKEKNSLSVDIVKFLLGQPSIELNLKDISDCTPIMYAAKHGQVELIKILFAVAEKKGLQQEILNETDKFGWNCLHFSSANNRQNIVSFLKDKMDLDVKESNNKTAKDLAEEKGYIIDFE